MPVPDFRALSVWANVAIFAGAAIGVWFAGTRLAYYADAISERTKISKAFLGLIRGPARQRAAGTTSYTEQDAAAEKIAGEGGRVRRVERRGLIATRRGPTARYSR